jgi:S1-C subfamily serine protease
MRILGSAVSIVLMVVGLLAEATRAANITAPITAESLGPSAPIASISVVAIICWPSRVDLRQKIGTGFVHKSGVIITAKHVLDVCRLNDLRIVPPNTERLVEVWASRRDLVADIAFLKIAENLAVTTLSISGRTSINVGDTLHIWGFPDGYSGRVPLLNVAYLSGIDRPRQGEPPGWLVTTPVRRGNSGGPVISANDGLVVGVISANFNYFPPYLSEAIKALLKQQSGPKYRLPASDGPAVLFSETQLIAHLIQTLRDSRDGLGFAVSSDDLRRFLAQQNIEP